MGKVYGRRKLVGDVSHNIINENRRKGLSQLLTGILCKTVLQVC